MATSRSLVIISVAFLVALTAREKVTLNIVTASMENLPAKMKVIWI